MNLYTLGTEERVGVNLVLQEEALNKNKMGMRARKLKNSKLAAKDEDSGRDRRPFE